MSHTLDSPFSRALIVRSKPHQTPPPPTDQSFSKAGAAAGTAVDLSLYPIDTLKTRLQSRAGFYASGGFRGIYAGVGSAALGAAPGAALFFVSYEWIKATMSRRQAELASSSWSKKSGHSGDKAWVRHEWLEPLNHMLAASVGEVAACAVRVPTEVVKQRAQAMEYRSSLAALGGILSLRREIGAYGVFRELFRGWNIMVMREVPFTVIQFPLWEALKEWRKRTEGKDGVTAFESAVFGGVSGAVAAGFTTPLDVLKTRMMLARERQKTLALLMDILRVSGPRAFFAGIGPRVFWISAGGFVFLGSYQFVYDGLASG